MTPKKRLGEMLMEAGVIGETQLKAALGHQRQWGVRLGQALVDLKLASEADIVRALARKYEFEVARLDALEPYALEQATALLPREFAVRNNVFPMAADTTSITVAMSDPTNLAVADEIRFRTGRRVKVCIGGDREVAQWVSRHYAGGGEVEAIALDLDVDEGTTEAVFDPFGGGSKDALEAFFGGGATPSQAAEPSEPMEAEPPAAAPPAAPPVAAPPAAAPHPAAPAPQSAHAAPPAPAPAAARPRPPRAGGPVAAPAVQGRPPGAPAPRAAPGVAPAAESAGRPASSPAVAQPGPSGAVARPPGPSPTHAAPPPAAGAAAGPASRPSSAAIARPTAPAPARAPAAPGTATPPPSSPVPVLSRQAGAPAPPPAAAPARPAAPPRALELEDAQGPPAPRPQELAGAGARAAEPAAGDGEPAEVRSPLHDLTEREVEILAALDRLASGGHAEPEIVRPTQAMAALVRLLLRKRVISERELVDELVRR